MRILLLATALLIGLLAAAQSGAPLTRFDVLNYTYAVELTDRSDSIYVTAAIRVKTLAAVDSFLFDLGSIDPVVKDKGMRIEKAEASIGGLRYLAHMWDKLAIYIPVEAGREVTFTVSYKGLPANGMIIGKSKFDQRTFFGDNWPNRGHQWLLCVDHPGDKATIEWQVLAPAHYTIVANGVETGLYPLSDGRRLWVFREDKPIPIKVAVIGAAVLQKQLASASDCLPIYNYVYPETGARGLQKMAVAEEIVRFFSSKIGPYPYRKLANVQSTTMFGGMENANNIFYDEHAIDDKSSMESLAAHEIAHQWFGNTVTEKTFAHVWISEGFATFLTHAYLEHKYGIDTLRKRLQADRAKVRGFLLSTPRPVVDNTTDLMSLLSANSYQKGALFLQALREKAGEDIFWKIVQTFYQRYQYANADTNDFRAVVEEITDKNWQSFFNEWLYSTTLPK